MPTGLGNRTLEKAIFGQGSVDDEVASIALPFSFPFFCKVHPAGSRLFVSANGFLSFESLSGVRFRSNNDLSATACGIPVEKWSCVPPGGIIAAMWDDLVWDGRVPGRGVYYSTYTALGALTPSVLIIAAKRLNTYGAAYNYGVSDSSIAWQARQPWVLACLHDCTNS